MAVAREKLQTVVIVVPNVEVVQENEQTPHDSAKILNEKASTDPLLMFPFL